MMRKIVPLIFLLLSVLAVPSVFPAEQEKTISGEAQVLEFVHYPPSVLKVSPEETAWIPYVWQTVTVVVYENEMDLQYIYLMAYENVFDNTDPDSTRNHYTWVASKGEGAWTFSCPLGSVYIDTSGCSVQEDPSENIYTATFKVRVAKVAIPTNWDLYARAVDNVSLDDHLENANAVTVQVYLEMDVSTNTLSFVGYPGQNVSPSQGPTSVTTTTNVAFKIGVKVAGDWVSDGNSMPASATKARGEGDWVSLSTSYQSVWVNITYGENIQKDIEWRLDIPDGIASGTYTNTFYVRVETIGEQNLVRNPSFEDGEYFWDFSDAKVFRTGEVVRSGSWSAKQENFGTSYEAYLTTDNIFAVTPGENYYLVGYYYLVNPGGGAIPENYTLFFRVRWYYENGAYTQIPGSGSPATAFDEWTKISFHMQAPAGAVRARIYITAKRASAAPSTKVYWDDFWLSTQQL